MSLFCCFGLYSMVNFQGISGSLYLKELPPPKTTITVETQPFEDVSAYLVGDFPACHVSFQGATQIDPWNILALLGLSNFGGMVSLYPLYGGNKT